MRGPTPSSPSTRGAAPARRRRTSSTRPVTSAAATSPARSACCSSRPGSGRRAARPGGEGARDPERRARAVRPRRHSAEGLSYGLRAARGAAAWLGMIDSMPNRSAVDVRRHIVTAPVAGRVVSWPSSRARSRQAIPSPSCADGWHDGGDAGRARGRLDGRARDVRQVAAATRSASCSCATEATVDRPEWWPHGTGRGRRRIRGPAGTRGARADSARRGAELYRGQRLAVDEPASSSKGTQLAGEVSGLQFLAGMTYTKYP